MLDRQESDLPLDIDGWHIRAGFRPHPRLPVRYGVSLPAYSSYPELGFTHLESALRFVESGGRTVWLPGDED